MIHEQIIQWISTKYKNNPKIIERIKSAKNIVAWGVCHCKNITNIKIFNESISSTDQGNIEIISLDAFFPNRLIEIIVCKEKELNVIFSHPVIKVIFIWWVIGEKKLNLKKEKI